RLATYSKDGSVRVWDSSTGEELFSIPVQARNAHARALFSPDGQSLALADMTSNGGTVRIVDAETGREQRTLVGPVQPVTHLAYSRDGKWLAAAVGDDRPGVDGQVKVWHTQSGHEVWTLGGHIGGIRTVAFSPDGRRLVTSGFDRNVKLWDLATGQEVL